MLKIVSLNCNGIRAATRKGLEHWLETHQPDIVCLQEVRASATFLDTWGQIPKGYYANWNFAEKSGYSGVAIFSKQKPDKISSKFGTEIFDKEGRWLRADFGDLTIVSIYLPSGTSGEHRQQVKYSTMSMLVEKLTRLKQQRNKIIIAGDFNIAHTKQDICNWRGNLKNSGFLPEEREWLTDLFDKHGWVDVFRQLNQEDHQYTWWSQRGQARTKNVGWRIDYQIVSSNVAKKAIAVNIDKSLNFSDHAPLVIDYSL